MMLILTIVLAISFQGMCMKIPIEYESNIKLKLCIKNLISRYYSKEHEITYVDINSGNNDIPEAMNILNSKLIVSRNLSNKINIPLEGYVICSGNSEEFIAQFKNLKKEATWDPSKKFIIIIDKLRKDELRDIFNEILLLHINDVLVINGTNQADIFTYNPFENYACGKYFDRIVEFGQCLKPTVDNLFPNKLVTGLRNCTFTATVSNFPPMTIHPSKNYTKKYVPGTEQYAFETISELEHFKIKYLYEDFSETFSSVNDDMEAKGYFNLIQSNKSDVLFGYTVLTDKRAAAFNYLYEHLAYTDEFTYIVHRAGFVPVWNNMYLEFSSTVWVLLLLSFILCSVLIVKLLRSEDRIAVVLKLLDNFLLHGYTFRCRLTVKIILLAWVWFAFLMNSFYQSSLVSLTTHPSKCYQVSSEKDLIKMKYRSCISPGTRNFLVSECGLSFKGEVYRCQNLVNGMNVVRKTRGLYTIAPLSIYQFNQYLFIDDTGTSMIYNFPYPVMKVIYAIFLYKGFPLLNDMHKHTLRLRESGLMTRHFNYLYFEQSRSHVPKVKRSFKARIIIPWNLLIIGTLIATITFILEILNKNNPVSSLHNKQNNDKRGADRDF